MKTKTKTKPPADPIEAAIDRFYRCADESFNVEDGYDGAGRPQYRRRTPKEMESWPPRFWWLAAEQLCDTILANFESQPPWRWEVEARVIFDLLRLPMDRFGASDIAASVK